MCATLPSATFFPTLPAHQSGKIDPWNTHSLLRFRLRYRGNHELCCQLSGPSLFLLVSSNFRDQIVFSGAVSHEFLSRRRRVTENSHSIHYLHMRQIGRICCSWPNFDHCACLRTATGKNSGRWTDDVQPVASVPGASDLRLFSDLKRVVHLRQVAVSADATEEQEISGRQTCVLDPALHRAACLRRCLETDRSPGLPVFCWMTLARERTRSPCTTSLKVCPVASSRTFYDPQPTLSYCS